MNVFRKMFAGAFLMVGTCLLCYFVAVAILPAIYQEIIRFLMWLFASFLKAR
jgi:hypothetical protein